MQKNPLFHFILYFVLCRRDNKGDRLHTENDGLWRETEVQELRSNGKFAPEMEVCDH